MAGLLTWLPQVLEDAGLKVATVEGWELRGGEMGTVRGVICHHTASPRRDLNMPSLNILRDGRSDLPGPLSQLGLGRDGTFYVIAAGRCNHAGSGLWNGVSRGNSHFIGIEAENTGRDDDFPWPQVQIEAYQRGVAAILRHLKLNAECCAGHKEYALPLGRKPDPSLDMPGFRAAVARILSGEAPPPQLIPAVEPAPSPKVGTPRPTLRRGSREEQWVRELQMLLGVAVDGNFGGKTEAAVRAFQRDQHIVPDGIVGPKSWAKLDAMIARP
jgi:peptidoglycan hydrolase-like protein with peptidoglycan-binding domain